MKMTSGIETCGSPQNMFTRSSPHSVNAIHEFSPNPSSPALSTTSSSSGTSKKSEPPKRLRYWLIDMIDSGEIPGLRWENSSHTVFRIPWKHAGKNNWKEEDCKIFQAWAEHRGKYRKGDKVDPATWKTRLRCALNKLGDIKELKQQSNLEGNDPYRIYQLMPEQDRAQEPEIYPRDTWTKESSRYNSPGSRSDLEAYANYHQQNIQLLNSTSLTPRAQNLRGEIAAPHYGRETMAPSQQYYDLPIDIRNHQELTTTNDKQIHAIQSTGQTTGPVKSSISYGRPFAPFEQNRTPSQHMQAANKLVSSNELNQDPFKMEVETAAGQNGNGLMQPIIDYGPPPPHEMEVYVQYRGNLISSNHVTVAAGCRIYYGDADLQHIAIQTHKLPSGVFGSDNLYQIGLPDCESFSVSAKQIALTKHVLNNIKRGLIIFYDKGCFYTRRLCQSRVFVFGPESQGDIPEKLDRDERVKVFDYENFYSELRRCVTERQFKLPQIEVKASFGQNWSIKTPIEKNLVTLFMIPRAARYHINKIRESYSDVTSITSNSIQESGPDSMDRLADRATRMSGECVNKLLLNIDPNAIYPLSETPVSRPVATNVPITSSEQQIGQFNNSGFFQQNMLSIAPLAPIGMDVEMAGMM